MLKLAWKKEAFVFITAFLWLKIMSYVNQMLVAVLMPPQIREREGEQGGLRPIDSPNKQNPLPQTARSSTCNYKCQQKLKRLIWPHFFSWGLTVWGEGAGEWHGTNTHREKEPGEVVNGIKTALVVPGPQSPAHSFYRGGGGPERDGNMSEGTQLLELWLEPRHPTSRIKGERARSSLTPDKIKKLNHRSHFFQLGLGWNIRLDFWWFGSWNNWFGSSSQKGCKNQWRRKYLFSLTQIYCQL